MARPQTERISTTWRREKEMTMQADSDESAIKAKALILAGRPVKRK